MRKFLILCLAILALLGIAQWLRSVRLPPTQQVAGPRIVSLAPNLTEIIFELGAGDQLVGVTTYCVYPPEARLRPKVGDFINPNFEAILQLHPTLVMAELWPSSKTAARLRQLGVTVEEVKSPASIAEIYEIFESIGRLVDRRERAVQIVDGMKKRIAALEASTAGRSHRPTVYLEIDRPSWTVGRPSFLHEAIAVCGGRNLFEDLNRAAVQASEEVIISRNPEIIVSLDAPAGVIRRRPGWRNVAAIRTGSIIDTVDRNLLSHGNHRLVDGMEQLATRFDELDRKR